MMFAAATVNDSNTQRILVSKVHDYASIANEGNSAPLTSIYDPITGSSGGSGTNS